MSIILITIADTYTLEPSGQAFSLQENLRHYIRQFKKSEALITSLNS